MWRKRGQVRVTLMTSWRTDTVTYLVMTQIIKNYSARFPLRPTGETIWRSRKSSEYLFTSNLLARNRKGLKCGLVVTSHPDQWPSEDALPWYHTTDNRKTRVRQGAVATGQSIASRDYNGERNPRLWNDTLCLVDSGPIAFSAGTKRDNGGPSFGCLLWYTPWW
jgi:hypothetical protein